MEEQSTSFIVDSENDTEHRFRYWDYLYDFDETIDTYAGCLSQYCNSTNSSHYDYKYYIDGIILFIVAIFGIIGTLMLIAVLFKPHLQNSFTKLLTVLCMFDCTFLIMAILYISLPNISCW